MQFSVGDKVVHPHHGAGQITALERKKFIDETKRYFVIEIPRQGLVVYIPRRKMEKVGIRPAVALAKLDGVLDTLRGEPSQLPKDYKKRQEIIQEMLNSGRVMQIARAVRDLTWRREHDRLTKKDTDFLKRGRELLAAEMALVEESEVSDVTERIDAALTIALDRFCEQEEAAATAN
jgi:CarD family transcriptional regulator